ncbi:MAG TPA: hypothetical protein ENJ19_11825 [Gammaproteobacteria bacterium]|nr:hypothetical protein [Gammaproteobacteria bacterium]
MSEGKQAVQVGAPDPEHRNSPIVEDTDEDFEVAGMALTEDAVCYFNSHAYRHGDYVCSGSELLHCRKGTWVRVGSCDPDNP